MHSKKKQGKYPGPEYFPISWCCVQVNQNQTCSCHANFTISGKERNLIWSRVPGCWGKVSLIVSNHFNMLRFYLSVNSIYGVHVWCNNNVDCLGFRSDYYFIFLQLCKERKIRYRVGWIGEMQELVDQWVYVDLWPIWKNVSIALDRMVPCLEEIPAILI